MHTITSWDQSVPILRRFECCYSVFAFSKTLTSQGMEPPTLCLSFLPLSVSSIQYPIRTTYNIYMLSWYNSQILFLYVIQILVCRISWVENCLVHPVRLAISAALAQGWSVWRWSGKIENVGIFTVALLLASVASKTWRLGRRFLRDGKSPLTSDILPGTDYPRKNVQIWRRKLYTKVGMAHGLW